MKFFLNNPVIVLLIIFFDLIITILAILDHDVIAILAGFAILALYLMIFIDAMEKKANEIKNKKSNKRIQKSSKINKKA